MVIHKYIIFTENWQYLTCILFFTIYPKLSDFNVYKNLLTKTVNKYHRAFSTQKFFYFLSSPSGWD